MENPEEILHSLEEFSKLKPKDIPRELEDYLCFVAKTGDPVYQWSAVKSLFREKLINVITEFYESCPTVEIPPCPNVEMFNYDSMKNFILEKLDTFAAAPFTVQRICELLTTPRKEYNRIDKYMRALEKNILVVSTTEPANRRNTEHGEGIVNGIEPEHSAEANSSNDINVEEMDDSPSWPKINQQESSIYGHSENGTALDVQLAVTETTQDSQENLSSGESRLSFVEPSTSGTDTVITCTPTEKPFVSIEPVVIENQPEVSPEDTTVTITAIPAPVQKRRDSIEPLTTDDNAVSETVCSTPTGTEDSINDVQQDEVVTQNETENKTEFEDSQASEEAVTTTVCDESDEDKTTVAEKKAETEEVIEQTSETKIDEVEVTQEDKAEPEPNPVPQIEPKEALQICDNTQEVKNTESCIESSYKKLEESTTEQTLKESEPQQQPAESTATIEEVSSSSGDMTNESTNISKEPSADQNNVLLDAEVDPIGILREKEAQDSPMDVDADENFEEPPTDVSSGVETSTN
ncbi:putative PPP4R2 protein [Trypoxylus dichotomus]